jgi:UPF0755 protein
MPNDARQKRSITARIALLLAVAILVLALETVAHFFTGDIPCGGPVEPITVSIAPGSSVTEIGKLLERAGIVPLSGMFRLAAHFLRADKRLQAGAVELSPGLPLRELIERLTHVQAAGIRVVVPEGLAASQIAELLHSTAGIDADEFLAAVHDTALADSLGFPGVSLEGYLFPDTYLFLEGMNARRAAMRMAWNFRRKVADSLFAEGEIFDLNRHEIVTLASILQWEVFSPGEWEIVSSVYHNRLEKDMLLQADPTVSYILGRGPSRLQLRDLRIDNPYNTYLYKGLPPGPINNPGLRAIRAALHPAQTNYLFFVARGDGSHIFTRTISEHLRAKAEADRLRRQQVLEDSTQKG